MEEVEYAGFWKRCLAGLGDGLFSYVVIGPVMLIQIYCGKELYLAGDIVTPFLVSGITVYCLAKWGSSPGKYMVGIRVKTLALGKIGWKEALLRNSVLIVFQFAMVAWGFGVVMEIPSESFSKMTYFQRGNLQMSTLGFKALLLLINAWTLSEMVVLLFNKKKRALHDFIAGTVVVVEKKNA